MFERVEQPGPLELRLLRGLNLCAQDLWNFKYGDYCFEAQQLCEKWVPARILGEDESAVLFDGKFAPLKACRLVPWAVALITTLDLKKV